MKSTNTVLTALLLGAASGLAYGISKRVPRYSFSGRAVLITGCSRGLGLVLARQLAMQGARLALLARDRGELSRAETQRRDLGAEVLSLPCDITRQEEVNDAVEQVLHRFAGLDVLINNAGIIQVGPLEHMTISDFEQSLAIHLYAPLFCTLAALPAMVRAGQGRIINIASAGGKIAMPHLLPYTAGKFAMVGLSDGLRAELRKNNIRVTTVCPGLMRTGSPRHAVFKGQHRREYAWFAIGDSLPLLSLSAERAAAQILQACRRGDARLVIGLHTKAAILLNELFPGAAAMMTAIANRLLPTPSTRGNGDSHFGHESESALSQSWLTKLSQTAAIQNNEVPLGKA